MTFLDRVRSRSTKAASLAVVVLLGLTGCAGSEADAVPTTVEASTVESDPSATPVFASDDAAVEAAVAAIQAAADAEIEYIGQPGDVTAGFERVASGQYLTDLVTVHGFALEEGHTYGGHQVVNRPVLQQRDDSGDRASVTLYVCIDSADMEIRWNDGRVVPFAEKDQNYEYVSTVTFEGQQGRVESQKLWQPDTCE